MRKIYQLIIALFVVSGVLGISGKGLESAYACSCAEQLSLEDAYSFYSDVFTGEVTSVQAIKSNGNTGTKKEVNIKVDSVWKGNAQANQNVYTASDSAACGYEFNIGGKYAFFAMEREGKIEVSLCSNTAPISSNDMLLNKLGAPILYYKHDYDHIIKYELIDEESKNKINDNLDKDHEAEANEISNDNLPIELQQMLKNRSSGMYTKELLPGNKEVKQFSDRLEEQQNNLPWIFMIAGSALVLFAIVLLLRRKYK